MKFQIKQSISGRWFFRLIDNNGHVIMGSSPYRGYTRKHDAYRAVRSVKMGVHWARTEE